MSADKLAHHLEVQVDNSSDFFWHRVRWKAVQANLPAPPEFGLVDVGAGVGLLGDYLAKDYPLARYEFVEPIETLEERLESQWGKAANVRESTFFEGADVVTLLDVLEHIADDSGFLSELADKMPRGSKLIMTVPAMQSLWSPWDEALGHYRRYDKPMLERLFAELPLQIQEISYLFPEMLPAALLRRRRGRSEPTSAAEFPELPATVNATLTAVGGISVRMRALWPRGTSLIVIATNA
ncbi:MAG: hypothetical protein NTV40_06140 [Solirubrobacterales bacterium]|nr:hypothetical protein [Solirubrobacterales bacterium]